MVYILGLPGLGCGQWTKMQAWFTRNRLNVINMAYFGYDVLFLVNACAELLQTCDYKMMSEYKWKQSSWKQAILVQHVDKRKKRKRKRNWILVCLSLPLPVSYFGHVEAEWIGCRHHNSHVAPTAYYISVFNALQLDIHRFSAADLHLSPISLSLATHENQLTGSLAYS